jgi:hypothetical protein
MWVLEWYVSHNMDLNHKFARPLVEVSLFSAWLKVDVFDFVELLHSITPASVLAFRAQVRCVAEAHLEYSRILANEF